MLSEEKLPGARGLGVEFALLVADDVDVPGDVSSPCDAAMPEDKETFYQYLHD